jgi:hypothetical protein
VRVIIATAFLRTLDEVDDIGEEGWRFVLAFADDTPDADVQAAILAGLRAEMAAWGPPDHQDLSEADMGFADGARICWQSSSVPVIRARRFPWLRRKGVAPC